MFDLVITEDRSVVFVIEVCGFGMSFIKVLE